MFPLVGASVGYSEMTVHALAVPTTIFLTLVLNRHRRAKIAEKIIAQPWALPGLKVLDKASAVCAGIIVTISFRHDWGQHPVVGIYLAIAALVLFSVSWLATWLAEQASDKKSNKILELTWANEGQAKTIHSLERKMSLAKTIAGLCNQLVERKKEVLRQKENDESKNIIGWNPRTQAVTVIQLIHATVLNWLSDFSPGAILRLGVYLPKSPDQKEMELIFAWNGHTEGCYESHPEKMQLVHPSGQYSVVVRTFHSEGNNVLHLTPDTHNAAGFQFWSDKQREHLLSIATFKFKVMDGGSPSAIVLEMDCNAAGFFDESRSEALSTLLVEMLRRFEYEMLCIDLLKKSEQQKEVTVTQ